MSKNLVAELTKTLETIAYNFNVNRHSRQYAHSMNTFQSLVHKAESTKRLKK